MTPTTNPAPQDKGGEMLQNEFEAWMASSNYPEIADIALERLPDGTYKSQLTFAAWQAWQGARLNSHSTLTTETARLAERVRVLEGALTELVDDPPIDSEWGTCGYCNRKRHEFNCPITRARSALSHKDGE